MTGSGDLSHRFRFEKREEKDDGYGNAQSDWTVQFSAWGKRNFLRGGESIMAARLEAKQPAILTVRNSAWARQVTADWRVVDEASGTVFAIRENPKHPLRSGREDRNFLEMLVEAGVAA